MLTVRKLVTEKARLIAAFDASGNESSGLIVVAGFISSVKDWKSFSALWHARLEEDGLEYFHMVDFASSREQFRQGWREDEARRQHLLGDLLGLIKSHAYRQFSSAVEMKTFSRLSAENKRKSSLNAYVLAARTCAADVRRWQGQEGFYSPTAFIFEDGDEGRGMLKRRFLEDGLSEPIFAPKRECAIVQAADILAYELYRPHRDMLAGRRTPSRFRYAFKELRDIPGVPGYYSASNLADVDGELRRLSE